MLNSVISTVSSMMILLLCTTIMACGSEVKQPTGVIPAQQLEALQKAKDVEGILLESKNKIDSQLQ